MRLSVVTSLYRSSPFIEEFHARVTAAAAAITSAYEIVFVNDGSPDDSLAVALQVRDRDSHVRIVDLSRNFGHHKALMTGLARSRGELVFLIDCDLEEDPAWLGQFHEELTRTQVDVVYGVQIRRKGSFVERTTGNLFYGVFNRLLAEPVPANLVTARLMTRRYVDALVQHRDREVFLAGLFALTGFRQLAVPVAKTARAGSSYTLRRRISLLVNAITSFSNRPLIYIFYLGIVVMLVTAIAAGILLVRALNREIGVPGYASLMVSIWFLGGLTLLSLGVIGIYLAKLFSESKDRPYTVIQAEYGSEPPA